VATATLDGQGLVELEAQVQQEASSKEPISESLGIAVLNSCAVNKDANLLRAVAEHIQSTSTPSPAVLGTLIRACAACELFEDACKIYESEMSPRGIQPDAQVSGVLMKAATQAGRAELVQQLLDWGSGELKQHMTVIKACGRRQDLSGAVHAFDRLKQSGAPLSPMVYNCLLNACIQCGDMASAKNHFQQMKELDCADVVSYNTMLKAHLQAGNMFIVALA